MSTHNKSPEVKSVAATKRVGIDQEMTPPEAEAFLDLESKGFEFKTVRFNVNKKLRSAVFFRGKERIELPLSIWKSPSCWQGLGG